MKGEVPFTLYGKSDKGWTDIELFSNGMKDLFLPNIPPARSVLEVCDYLSSLMTFITILNSLCSYLPFGLVRITLDS